jgi:CheY-specific phosphatase CheX
MSDLLRDQLGAATIDALETAAFLFAMPAEEPVDLDAVPSVVTARVAFSGPRAGELRIRAPQALLALLAANMLGADAPDEPMQLDAFGELANIVCGNVLPRVDDSGPFRLAPPRVSPADSVPGAASSALVEVALAVDDQPLFVSLRLDATQDAR